LPDGFWEEERGQGALEYILLVGGIVAVAVMIFSVYYEMTRQAGVLGLNSSVDNASSAIEDKIVGEIANGITG